MSSRFAIVAAAALVLAACAAPADEAGTGSPDPTASSAPAPGEPLEWDDAEAGICFDRDDGGTMLADCDNRHDGQVVGVGTLPSAGGPYPGPDVAEREAFEFCAAAFDEFVGGPSDELVLSWSGADEEDWTRHSDQVLCEIASASTDPLLGSAEGSGASDGSDSGDSLILLLSEDFRGLPDQPAADIGDGLSEQVLDGQLLLTPAQPNMSYTWGVDLPSVGGAEVTATGGPAGESTGAGAWGVALSEQLSSGSSLRGHAAVLDRWHGVPMGHGHDHCLDAGSRSELRTGHSDEPEGRQRHSWSILDRGLRRRLTRHQLRG